MVSYLNEMENEGLIVIGRRVSGSFETSEEVEAVAKTVDGWAKRTGRDLGLVWCGTTINWPDDVEGTASIVGLITCVVPGEDDESKGMEVDPDAMDLSRAQIPDELWKALKDEHGLTFKGKTDVFFAAAGWTWARMTCEGAKDLYASTEDEGYIRVPPSARDKTWTMVVSYC